MKHTATTAIITGALAVGAGLAIAGFPTSTSPGGLVVSGDALATTTTTRSATPPSAPTSNNSAPTTTTPSSTTTTSAQPAVATPPTTEPAGELLSRSELRVATANATDQSGVAGQAAEAVRPLGYGDIRPVDADPTSTSAVFYAPGLEAEAARLANDILFKPTQIAPMELMPTLRTELTFDLVAVIGLDRV